MNTKGRPLVVESITPVAPEEAREPRGDPLHDPDDSNLRHLYGWEALRRAGWARARLAGRGVGRLSPGAGMVAGVRGAIGEGKTLA